MNKMKSKDMSKKYRTSSEKLAELINQLSDIEITYKFLMEISGDSGDPYYYLNDAMSVLAKALAKGITYSVEYDTEEEKDYNKNEN